MIVIIPLSTFSRAADCEYIVFVKRHRQQSVNCVTQGHTEDKRIHKRRVSALSGDEWRGNNDLNQLIYYESQKYCREDINHQIQINILNKVDKNCLKHLDKKNMLRIKKASMSHSRM